MKMKPVIAVWLFGVLAGCATTPYEYHVEPTPIEKGVTTYRLQSLDVDLQNGRNERPVRGPHVTEDVLNEQFREDIRTHLADRGLLASEGDENVVALDIDIHYQRRFVWTTSALVRPWISHEVEIKRDGKVLASTTSRTYTTSYHLFKDAFREIGILFLMSGPEDEREDVALVSEVLVRDLAELGEEPGKG